MSNAIKLSRSWFDKRTANGLTALDKMRHYTLIYRFLILSIDGWLIVD
ncbi:MAG: hypothetical protein ACXW1Z_25550 [Methylobacter sp.]